MNTYWNLLLNTVDPSESKTQACKMYHGLLETIWVFNIICGRMLDWQHEVQKEAYICDSTILWTQFLDWLERNQWAKPHIPHHLSLLSECGCPWSSCVLLLLPSLLHRGGLHAQTVSYSKLFCKCLCCYSITALMIDIVPEDTVSEYDITVNSLHKRRQKTYPQMYMLRKHTDSPMVVVMVTSLTVWVASVL